jgi:HK97 gp10 family phage protein
MVIRLHITWHGLDAARARLEALAARTDVRTLTAIAADTAAAMHTDAVARAPARTGALRRSISAALTITPAVSGATVIAELGAAAHYAPFVEYGTRRRRGHPFLRPALDAAAPRLIARLTRQIDGG